MRTWFDMGEHPPAHSHPCGLILERVFWSHFRERNTTGMRMGGWVFASVKPGEHDKDDAIFNQLGVRNVNKQKNM